MLNQTNCEWIQHRSEERHSSFGLLVEGKPLYSTSIWTTMNRHITRMINLYVCYRTVSCQAKWILTSVFVLIYLFMSCFNKGRKCTQTIALKMPQKLFTILLLRNGLIWNNSNSNFNIGPMISGHVWPGSLPNISKWFVQPHKTWITYLNQDDIWKSIVSISWGNARKVKLQNGIVASTIPFCNYTFLHQQCSARD